MPYEPWLKQEHLEACFSRVLTQAFKDAGMTPPHHIDNTLLATLYNDFTTVIETLQRHIAEVTDCRGQHIVRANDVVRAANAMDIKLYGYDSHDASRLALLHPKTDQTKCAVDEDTSDENRVPLYAADEVIIYSEPEDALDSEDSDSDLSSLDDEADTVSLGDGDFSECESVARDGAKGQDDDETFIYSVENPYSVPRRVMLRLFRDTSLAVTLEARPISRKALSAFHNVAETLLRPLLTSCLVEFAARPAPSSPMQTTPTINRRGKKRMSGDVFQPMVAESQKRKSPRLATKKSKSMGGHLDFCDDAVVVDAYVAVTPQRARK
ncbi:Aste57867_4959 [Aphanomyces stellatus]|uniref:Aste57867_4959 protein n=1 Tax=Aphanomyces stellatus TaxID=120398 RepID=A0A485KCL3_9STRA|nr:hypothetical protein As57867_004946 [Aphanomyces stellatus]VFT82047.1 Aste57867_4959 [Aphanomyces stellatus]